jgi:ABC-type uncharacterized transport system substrate-binding protein
MQIRRALRALAFAAAAIFTPVAPDVAAKTFKVLVVMSYEADNPWVREIAEGIDAVLGPHAEVTYFYMDTKVDPANGPKRAAEALAKFRDLRPDGVIAADDDAQAMFVVPHLSGKVAIPVMFNGVNAAPSFHGFPSANVSGVLERAHVGESLAFIKQMVPAVQSACFMTNDVPPGRSLLALVEEEKAGFPVRAGKFHLVSNAAALEQAVAEMRGACDVLFVDSLEGITDESNAPMNNAQVMKRLRATFPGPILAGNRYQVEQGAWAAVVKTGQEQGDTSAEMLLKAMRGTPVAAIPIVRNVRGQRVINVTAMEAAGIEIRPQVLRGAALVRERN